MWLMGISFFSCDWCRARGCILLIGACGKYPASEYIKSLVTKVEKFMKWLMTEKLLLEDAPSHYSQTCLPRTDDRQGGLLLTRSASDAGRTRDGSVRALALEAFSSRGCLFRGGLVTDFVLSQPFTDRPYSQAK